MLEEEGQDVMRVARALQEITEEDVEVRRQVLDLHTKLPEGDVGLVVEIVVKPMHLALPLDQLVQVELVELLQQILFG